MVGLLLVVVSRLSDDAVSLAVGLLFGMLAGIPAALFTLYASSAFIGGHRRPSPCRRGGGRTGHKARCAAKPTVAAAAGWAGLQKPPELCGAGACRISSFYIS